MTGLLGCKTEPMNDDISKLFINLTLTEMAISSGRQPNNTSDMDAKLADCFPYQVLKKRLEVFKQHFSPSLDISILPQIFCALISDRPAVAVMWAFTLNEIFVKTGKQVTMQALANHFPLGFPIALELERCWDAQKVKRDKNFPMGSDNAVDDFKNWSLPTPVMAEAGSVGSNRDEQSISCGESRSCLWDDNRGNGAFDVPD